MMQPIIGNRLGVVPARSSARNTPISENGSGAMMASGGVKLANCDARNLGDPFRELADWSGQRLRIGARQLDPDGRLARQECVPTSCGGAAVRIQKSA
jgi:hypothetical protein